MATRLVNDPRARERPCLRCGYSLRRLADSRHCPECGLSVWLSLNESDALDRSNPDWLRRLSLATWVLAGAQVLGIAAWMTMWSPGWLWVAVVRAGANPFTGVLLLVGGYAIACDVGMLLLSFPENRHPDRLKVPRQALRILGVLGLSVGVFVMSQAFGRILGWRWLRAALIMWEWGVGLVLLGGAVAVLAYLRRLARRVPSPRAAWACAWLMVGTGVLAWPAVPCLGTALLFGAFDLIYYLPWIYLPGMFALFAWFAVTFRRAAALAQKEWAAETAGGAQAVA